MDLASKYVSFEERFDFVLEEVTEDLHDRQALVSDLEIPAGTIAHKDTVVSFLVTNKNPWKQSGKT